MSQRLRWLDAGKSGFYQVVMPAGRAPGMGRPTLKRVAKGLGTSRQYAARVADHGEGKLRPALDTLLGMVAKDTTPFPILAGAINECVAAFAARLTPKELDARLRAALGEETVHQGAADAAMIGWLLEPNTERLSVLVATLQDHIDAAHELLGIALAYHRAGRNA